MDEKLLWRETSRKTVFSTRIFSIGEALCTSPAGGEAVFSFVESRPWAMVLPIVEIDGVHKFIMVRQWRHGAQAMSVEFPGGVVETGESIEAGARRELREETGWHSEKLIPLGEMNPNPAFMTNSIAFFLAENPVFKGSQELDRDEFVAVELHDTEEVVRNMGKAPYIHSLMATGLALWLVSLLQNPRNLGVPPAKAGTPASGRASFGGG